MDYKDRSGVLFSVKDTGIGISTDDQKRLFQRFSQISNTEVNTIEGTGLGLVLVKEFSEMHGGFVQLESDMDQGSQFDVWLPLDAHLN
jgi:signal transduction histidine kinase